MLNDYNSLSKPILYRKLCDNIEDAFMNNYSITYLKPINTPFFKDYDLVILYELIIKPIEGKILVKTLKVD